MKNKNEPSIPRLSAHALDRIRQRGIHLHQVDLVWRLGTPFHAKNGCTAYVYGKQAAKAAAKEDPGAPAALNIAIIMGSDGTILTAHRVDRLPHGWCRQ